jgi:putative endonuclease
MLGLYRTTDPRPLGRRGEEHAARFLQRRGYRILQRNYSCPVGEVDLIAADRDMLVFIEVKTRRSDAKADPEVNVTPRKQAQVSRVARWFVKQMRAEHLPARFDVVAVVLPDRGQPRVEHFVDAFPATRHPRR